MTEKSDSERLDEIESDLITFSGEWTEHEKIDIEWLISSLKLAWAQNEVMEKALEYYTEDFDGTRNNINADDALKRCEELKGGK